MKADNVTEEELTELFRMVESKLKTTQMDADATAQTPQALASYRPGVGIMLLNRNNRVFVGRRRRPKGGRGKCRKVELTGRNSPCGRFS